MIRRSPRSTPTATCFPYTTLCRSSNVSPISDRRSLIVNASLISGSSDNPNILSIQKVRMNRNDCRGHRSEEHTSELQSLMRHSYAVFCLKTKQYHIRSYDWHIHTDTYINEKQ